METLKRQYPYFQGQRIKVKFGGFGTQLAEVVEDCGRKFAFGSAKWDYLRVRKYRASSNSWTGVVRVSRADVLGLAEEA